MPMTYSMRTASTINSLAASFQKVTDKLKEVTIEMKANKLEEAYMPWGTRHDEMVQFILEVAYGCETAVRSQIMAINLGVPSRFEEIKRRSSRDVEARRLRNQDEPRQPRGRPRKMVANVTIPAVETHSCEHG